MTSEAYVPKRYVSLENPGYAGPYYGRQVPQYRPKSSSNGCGCLRCCCCFFKCCRCCICSILILIILLVVIVLALYYFLKPSIPTYNVESLDVKAFDLQTNKKLYSDIAVVVKAENTNEDIGLDYLHNEVSIIYSGSQLCSGQFPPFLQPVKNTTMINVDLKGEIDFGPEMQHHLMQDQKMGNIPLLITVKVPIRLVINDLVHLRKFVVNVNCSVVLDKLQLNNKPNILKKDFNYGVQF